MRHFGPATGTTVRTLVTVAALIVHQSAIAQDKTGGEIKIGGYVKVDFIQDFDPVGNIYQWKTNSIPVDGAATTGQSGQTTLHAKETRLTLTLLEDTPRGKFKAYVEGDFFGDNTTFRIRHAYGELGEVLGGQTWTTFMDISARPRSLDYEGPDAEIFVMEAVQAGSAVLAYERHWNDTLQSNIALAAATLDDEDRLGPSGIKETRDARLNLIWAAYSKVDVGGEVLYGKRENQNGADA